MSRIKSKCFDSIESSQCDCSRRFDIAKVAHSLQTAGWQTSHVGKRQRVVCRSVVQSMTKVRLIYPIVLDAMEDGVFAIATFPGKIARRAYPHVYELLNTRNYTARYGKYVMDSATGNLKFRFFRSSTDVMCNFTETMRLLTSFPVRMLDNIVDEISSFLDDVANTEIDMQKGKRNPQLKRCVLTKNKKNRR